MRISVRGKKSWCSFEWRKDFVHTQYPARIQQSQEQSDARNGWKKSIWTDKEKEDGLDIDAIALSTRQALQRLDLPVAWDIIAEKMNEHGEQSLLSMDRQFPTIPSIDLEFSSTATGKEPLTVGIVDAVTSKPLLHCKIDHGISVNELIKQQCGDRTDHAARVTASHIRKWMYAELPALTPHQLFDRLQELNFSFSLEWHTALPENGDIGLLEKFFRKHKLDPAKVLPPLERRYSPARLLRWELAWANGIKWEDHEIKRYSLERMYLLLVPDGEYKYIHHDAEVDAIKQADVTRAVLQLVKTGGDKGKGKGKH
ncbi:uncharacterized protein AB675_3243 [Cyphellophora attinorum]|uniref:Uncharacterized protein n=1 Tax=Cyphellophora attinorum TaxID=1664694 RepID=A0A0N1NVY6_9EURO|nr:uncharacterized protein AB675_3243 [Phialophora attinorum]KPI34394.1 hypothetical protein AB675_3243 [Phialophora attinorum]